MKSQHLMLIASVVIAAAAGFLAFNYLSAAKSTTAVVTRHVVVAAKEIPARAQIAQDMLKVVDRSSGDVDSDATSDPKAIIGSIALTTIPAGAAITGSRIGSADTKALTVRLQPGMRALSIPIDPVRGVSGLVQPGDRVDVIAVSARNGDGNQNVETCLHGVKVLAMGTTLEELKNPKDDETAPAATTVTLEVTPKQAELLTLADSNATLRLALRPPGDKANSKDNFSLFKQTPPQSMPVMQAPVAAAAAAPAPVIVQKVVQAAPAPVQKAAPRELMITVIDGDHIVGSGK